MSSAKNKEEKTPKAKGKFKKGALFGGIILLIGGVSSAYFLQQQKIKAEEERIRQEEEIIQTMTYTVQEDVIYNNIFINNVSVSGLNRIKARKKVEDELKNIIKTGNITLSSGDKEFTMSLSELDFKANFKKVVDEAFDFAREGELKERYDKVISLEENPMHMTSEITYDKEKLKAKLEEFAGEVLVMPTNATMQKNGDNFEIIEGITGLELDVDATADKVYAVLDGVDFANLADFNMPELNDEIILRESQPEYSAEDFDSSKELIGTAKSFYTGRGTNRGINMEVAASNINNYVVYPGQIFSTNKAFGPTTFENGYRDAPVIVEGELVDGLGGGVCQVSSTLYNALLYSELEITERRNHSLKVGYYGWGYDATLAGDYIDLKFKNDTDYPVLIESYLSTNEVIVNIYGKEIHEPGRTVELNNSLVTSKNPPAEKLIYTDTLAAGARQVKVSAQTGYTYDLFKNIYQDGVLIETVKVNTSVYSPRQAQILVGSGGASAPVAETAPVTEVETPAPAPVETPPAETPTEPLVPESEG